MEIKRGGSRFKEDKTLDREIFELAAAFFVFYFWMLDDDRVALSLTVIKSVSWIGIFPSWELCPNYTRKQEFIF